ncbi:hypothetical protein BB934_27845 (plasmid) [Microvirga ossetica]|uniref:Tc1-like transposase DDE domain-containing protein n=1 Tax=Microvirga ossetica TaxID=1882682 RepID=A0A1B2EQQ9_9HYPH|nr:transposase [Microvirga ossetica]ANY82172.1 hypothetical protein BB934_27845 [Microvirga ossetica]
MRQQPLRLVFLDETLVNTRRFLLCGRSRKSERLWASPPCAIGGPIARRIFETYVEIHLAPILTKGDVVILDNLPADKSEKVAQCLNQEEAWFLLRLSCSSDHNPIEQAFAKLKAHLRAGEARTLDALWRAIGDILNLFDRRDCWNYLRAARYTSVSSSDGLIERDFHHEHAVK